MTLPPDFSDPINRRQLFKRAGVGASLLTLPGVLGAFATSARAAGAPKSGGTILVGLYLEPTALDPQRGYYWESARVWRNIFEPLIQEDLSTNVGVPKLLPGLATAWKPNADYTTWNFTLRQGVKFQDGTPFNAQAVHTVISRFADPSFKYYDKVSAALLGANFPFKDFGPVGEYGYKISFDHPYQGLPRLLAQDLGGLPIFSPAALQKYGNDNLGQHPTGTGPYSFVSRELANDIVLTRNKHYWGKPPYLDGITFRIIADDPTRLAALESGEVHIISRVVPSDVNSLVSKGFVVPAGTGAQLDYVAFNWKNKYIQNANVRKAIAQAIDAKGDVQDIYDGYGQALRTFLPPGNVAYNPNANYGYTYNPTKAKAALAASGFKPGEVTFNIFTWVEDTPEAEYLAQNFQAVGINAKVVGLSSADLGARTEDPEPGDGFSLGEWGSTAPEWVWQGYNSAVASLGGAPYVDSKVINAALTKARYNPDASTYVKYWQEADAAVVNDGAIVPTVNFHRYYALSPKVGGFVWPNTNWYSLWDVWLNE